MAAAADSAPVGRHDDEHLRRFAAARTSGDTAAMRLHWEEIVIAIFDRVDGLVGTTHKGRLDDEEHELAVGMALTRISSNLMNTFEGTTMGELVNAMKTLARGICIDVQRQSIAARRRETRSLDDGWHLDAEDAPSPSWDAHEARRRAAREEGGAQAGDFLRWALPQLVDTRREVMALTLLGASVPEICDQLGITSDNAYQLRSRGSKDLAKLKRQYDAS